MALFTLKHAVQHARTSPSKINNNAVKKPNATILGATVIYRLKMSLNVKTHILSKIVVKLARGWRKKVK